MGKKNTTTTVTEQKLPEWYSQLGQQVASKAYQATSEPYQAYGAPRIAGFAPEQQKAFGMVRQGIGQWEPYMEGAATAAGRGLTSWTAPGVAQAYMSPYIESVVRGIGTTAGRNLYENILPQLNRTFVGSGTFGGSRSAEFMNRAVRDTQAQALSQQIEALNKGYGQAADIYGAEAGRALTGAELFANLGQQYQGQRYKDIAALEAVGQQRQQLGQASADLAYQDFLAQRGYPLQMAKEFAGIAGQINPAGGTTTQAVTTPGPSTAQQIAGIGTTVLGGLGKLGRFKEGGHVKKTGLGWLKEAA